MKIITVRLKDDNKVCYYKVENEAPQTDDVVIIETPRGLEPAIVVRGVYDTQMVEEMPEPKKIIRIATEEDIEQIRNQENDESDALTVCREKIEKHGLDMSLVDVNIAFDNSKVTFYFISDGRVDFRELVRDLASVFRKRIELRQIGVRDGAKMIGGLGICGRVICCKQYLDDFHSVSIRMAKDQNLSLTPSKISGICGRLMCCLKYEQDCYEQTRKRMPAIGSMVKTSLGQGVVISNHIIKEEVRIRTKLPDGSFEVADFELSQVESIKPKHDCAGCKGHEGSEGCCGESKNTHKNQKTDKN